MALKRIAQEPQKIILYAYLTENSGWVLGKYIPPELIFCSNPRRVYLRYPPAIPGS